MKEIKFRGYNKNLKRFIYGTNLIGNSAIENGLYTLSDVWKLIETGAFEYAGQYTGRKDRNGVEMYEGDLVNVWDGKVYWDTSAACFRVEMTKHGYTEYEHLYKILNAYEIEVIGNIYENPELVRVL